MPDKPQTDRTHIFSEDEYADFYSRFSEFTSKNQNLPQENLDSKKTGLQKDINGLDLSRYFEIFDQVSIEEGYKLDYIYAFDGGGGQPLLYNRKNSDQPITSVDEYYRTFNLKRNAMLLGQSPAGGEARPWLERLRFEPTDTGFLQFALFCARAHRFYLFWHSCYNTRAQIMTRAELEDYTRKFEKMINLQPPARVLELDYHPVLERRGETGTLKFLAFDPFGGALYWQRVTVARPNHFVEETLDEIIRGQAYFF